MKTKICGWCQGEGKVDINSESENHPGSHYVKCTNCNGTGKIKIDKYTFMVPYDADIATVNIYCTKIRKLILELEEDIRK